MKKLEHRVEYSTMIQIELWQQITLAIKNAINDPLQKSSIYYTTAHLHLHFPLF